MRGNPVAQISGRMLFILLALPWLRPSPAAPQDSTGLLSGSEGSTYFYRTWTTQSGLPQESVHSVAQTVDATKVGFLIRRLVGLFYGFSTTDRQVAAP